MKRTKRLWNQRFDLIIRETNGKIVPHILPFFERISKVSWLNTVYSKKWTASRLLSQSIHTFFCLLGGRYGLGSKDVTPDQISAVFDELQKDPSIRKKRFTIGIVDDVSYQSLETKESLDLTEPQTFQVVACSLNFQIIDWTLCAKIWTSN